MDEILLMLKELNRIEHLLDTIEYHPSVPTVKWQDRRNAIEEKLKAAGFRLSSLDPVELGETEYSNIQVLYTIERRKGFPEEWEELK